MSLLKIYIEGKLPLMLGKSPFFDDLPTAIKEKVLFIASLINEVILLSTAEKNFPEKISFNSLSNGKNNSCDETSCVVCGERFREESRVEIMDGIEKVLNERFEPLYSQKDDRFEDLLTRMKNRLIVIDEILTILYEVKPELAQRIFSRITEHLVQPIKSPEKEQQESRLQIERIKLMAQPEYEPGQEIDDLLKSLNDLNSYWLTWPLTQEVLNEGINASHDEITIRVFSELKSIKANEQILDLNFVKIAYQLGMKMEHIRYYGRRERNRGLVSGKAKQEQTAKTIINIFWELFPKFTKELFPNGIYLNAMATMIRNNQEKDKRVEAPNDIKTIRNCLLANEKIRELFKPVSVGKKTFYIMEV